MLDLRLEIIDIRFEIIDISD